MALELAVTPPDADTPPRRYLFARAHSPIVIGRRGGVDVLLPSDDVEPVHARIEYHQAVFCLVDSGAPLATLLNGARLPAGRRLPLSDGDRIDIAGYLLDVRLEAERDRSDELNDLGTRVTRELFARLPQLDSQPRLEVGERTLVLDAVDRLYTLGHGASGLVLDEVDMWREQISLERRDTEVIATPLANRPVLRNGERILGPLALRDGDELKLGEATAIFRDPATAYLDRIEAGQRAPELTLTAPPPSTPRWSPESLPALGRAFAVFCVAAALAAALWLLSSLTS